MSDVDLLMIFGCVIGALVFLGLYFLAERSSKQLRPSDLPIEHFMVVSSKTISLIAAAGLIIVALIIIVI